MRPPFRTVLPSAIALVVALAGCGRDDRPSAGGPSPLAGDGSVEWQGVLPCADCDAIETRLRIDRDGDAATYRLDERFVAIDGALTFSEDGDWRMVDGVLALEGREGARRHFAVLADGRLRPGDADGDPWPGRDGDMLVPVVAERR